MSDPATARRLLRQVFGFDSFRPHQEEIVCRVAGGADALVIMPTGGGKSLCYQLPALLRPGVALIVSPLISLMQDQVAALRQVGVRAAFVNSTLPATERARVEGSMERGELDLVYVAPERLLTPPFLERLDSTELALLAIDEAHCISQWGHDFRPDYLQLADVRGRLPGVPTVAVTATADERTRREILERLGIPTEGLFVTGFDRPNLRYAVVAKESPRRQLLRFIQDRHAGEAGIVYCLTRRRVEQIAAWLASRSVDAVPYHAGLDGALRSEHQRRFLEDDGVVVVATVAFGMGIDKPDVRFVAHLDLPHSLEAYYQESGRAGRDGLPADVWMTYRLGDVMTVRRLLEGSEAPEAQKRIERQKLDALLGYCESVACRRRVLLGYFGEDHPGDCDNCDNCLDPAETWDGTEAARKLLSCAYRTGQRFGAGHLVDVLLARETEKVRRHGHHRVSTFGIGTELGAGEWRSVARQLVAADLLRVDAEGHGTLALTPASRPVLRGEERVRLRRDRRPPQPTPSRAGTPRRADLHGQDEHRLFEALRRLRLRLAQEQGVPPYVVFSDATLVEMVRRRPASRRDMAGISGVGAVKLERYADAFLACLEEATGT